MIFPQPIRDDLKTLLSFQIPTHIEVCARVTASALLGYILSLGDFSNVIPQSQRAMISMLPCTLSLLFPTLLFSIGAAIFPIQMVLTLMGLVAATLLLACATVSRALYIAMFGLVAFIISGTRFNKSTGALTTILVMNTALNSQSLAEPAEALGLDFVRSLWTETGLTNSNAIFVNSLIGFLWICAIISLGRIMPPFRTARASIAKGLLPGCLETMVDIIRLIETVYASANQISSNTTKMNHLQADSTRTTDAADDAITTKDHPAALNESVEANPISTEIEEQHTTLVTTLIHTKAILDDGGIAGLTAFEPRLLRCGPPDCGWLVLHNLVSAIDSIALAALALEEMWRDPRINNADLQFGRVLPNHEKAALSLQRYANALRTMTKVSEEEADSPLLKEGTGTAPESEDFVSFLSLSTKLAVTTNAWIDVAGPPDHTRSYFDAASRVALKQNLMPWIGASGLSFFLAICRNTLLLLKVQPWRRIFLPPHCDAEKAVWCVKFAVGISALVTMSVYWEKYADLEVPVVDNGELPTGAHFSGWSLIAYAMLTTQTTEGTVKKGLLRLLGTAA